MYIILSVLFVFASSAAVLHAYGILSAQNHMMSLATYVAGLCLLWGVEAIRTWLMSLRRT